MTYKAAARQARLTALRILRGGFRISLDLGELGQTKAFERLSDLSPELGESDEDLLVIHLPTGEHIGWVQIIYDAGEDNPANWQSSHWQLTTIMQRLEADLAAA